MVKILGKMVKEAKVAKKDKMLENNQYCQQRQLTWSIG